jgi:ATP synthase in type III secretion protein N
VLASASRVMNAVAEPAHRNDAAALRELMAKYADVELLVKIGEYQRGTDPLADDAIEKHDAIRDFLRQDIDESSPMGDTLAQLATLVR